MAYYQGARDPAQHLWRQSERRDKQMRDLLNMFMMMKQLGAEREEKGYERKVEAEEREREFQRSAVQEDLWKAQAEKFRQPAILKKPTMPSEVRQAVIASGQGEVPHEQIDWKPVGRVLQEWHKKAPSKPTRPVWKEKKDFARGLHQDAKDIIEGIQNTMVYKADPNNPKWAIPIKNLRDVQALAMKAIAYGADKPLSDELWLALQGASSRLDEIQKSGLYPEEEVDYEKKYGIKIVGGIPSSQVPKDADKRQLPNGKIIALIDDVWFYVI